MDEILARCGYRCGLCLAYRPNVEANPARRQELSDGWHKYFGFRIPAEEIVCDGCMAENPRLIDKACPVRPCVIARGFANCSQCPDYVCAKLAERLVVYEELAARTPFSIPPEDRARFIAPYENKRRLDRLRRPSVAHMTSKSKHVIQIAVPRLIVSVLSGAAFYVAWMAVFIVSHPYHSPLLRGLFWILAPITTGLGFSVGAALFTRLHHLAGIPFRRFCCYPLLACSVGAAVVFPFGPMLIVFAMCLFGSLAMLSFELADLRRFAAAADANHRESPIHDG